MGWVGRAAAGVAITYYAVTRIVVGLVVMALGGAILSALLRERNDVPTSLTVAVVGVSLLTCGGIFIVNFFLCLDEVRGRSRTWHSAEWWLGWPVLFVLGLGVAAVVVIQLAADFLR